MSDQYEPKLPDRILIRGEGEQACLLQAVEGRVALLVCGRPGGGGHGAKTVAHIDLVGRRQGRALRVDVDRALLSIDATGRKSG